MEGGETTFGYDPDTTARCFYQFFHVSGQIVNFTDNFAKAGGNDIYGSPLSSYCISNDHNGRSNEDKNKFFFRKRLSLQYHPIPNVCASVTIVVFLYVMM